MSQAGFNKVWEETLRNLEESGDLPAGSSKLKPLLYVLYEEAIRRPFHPKSLYRAVEAVLQFLSQGEGRTSANCRAAGSFLDSSAALWELDWTELPVEFADILGTMACDMFGALGDTSHTTNFGGLPEQILQNLRSIKALPTE